VSHIVSVLIESLDYFDPGLGGLAVHGANLQISGLVRGFAADPRVQTLEIFLHSRDILNAPRLQRAAQFLLPPERRGLNHLVFHPRHALPEVWRDGQPRILFCVDPEWLPRDRYLRDRFAAGPMPIVSDTHALGYHRLWASLWRLAQAPPVAFDSMACISRACREALQKSFNGFLAPEGSTPPCRLDLLPHPVDTEMFQPRDAAGQREARRILGLPETGQISLFLSRLTPYDKADLLPLLRCFAQVTQRPDDYLLIAGAENAPGYVAKLRAQGDLLGLGERLILQPEFDMALRPLFYGAADLFVFPADCIQESLGNVVLEAMASGLPVIASDWDGMRDLVADGETGYLIPTYGMPATNRLAALSPATDIVTEYLCHAQTIWVETNSLTAALKNLLETPAQRKAMGDAGRRRMEMEFSRLVISGRWHELWDELSGLAARESDDDRARRRGGAGRLGLPTPYQAVFSHYATETILPEQCSVRLSDVGWAVFRRELPLEFYDETLTLLHKAAMDSLFTILSENGPRWMLLSDITQRVSTETTLPANDVRYHLALLLKRDLLEFSTTT